MPFTGNCYYCGEDLDPLEYFEVQQSCGVVKVFCTKLCQTHYETELALSSIGAPPVARIEVPPAAMTAPPEPAGGLKFDESKLPLQLLPFDAITEIAKVLAFGAKKYAPNNWRKGIAYGRLFRAAVGHCISWWMGEDLDPETSLSHLAHAGCCVLFLIHFTLQGRATLDDRKENQS